MVGLCALDGNREEGINGKQPNHLLGSTAATEFPKYNLFRAMSENKMYPC